MTLKTLNKRARLLLRRRTSRGTTVRAGQPEPQPRVYSLLLPQGYPPERK